MQTAHKTFFWMLAAVLVSGLGMAFTFWSFVQIEDASNQRMHSRKVLVQTDTLLLAVKDAELGERNYVLTGDESYLQPYLQARTLVEGSLLDLRALTRIPAARTELDTAIPLLDAKLKELATAVELRRAGTQATALAHIQRGEGQRLNNAIRILMDALVKIQGEAQQRYETELARSMRRLFAAVVIMGVLALLFTTHFVASMYREAHRIKRPVQGETQDLLGIQERANASLQETNASADIALLNPVAEVLTGWSKAQAVGSPIDNAQQALQDSAVLVRSILNTVADGIVTFHAQSGSIESTNPAVAALFGYTDAELKGKGFALLVPELNQIHQHTELAYFGASAEAQAKGLTREVVGVRKDGSPFALEIATSEMLLRGERFFTVLLRDVSTRRAAEEALRKAGALQRAIFNSEIFSSIATDTHGVIQIFNVGAQRMLGYSASDVVNTVTPADLSDPHELVDRAKELTLETGTAIAPGFDALVFKASRGIEDIYELTYIRKDGQRVPALVSVSALYGELDAIIGYLLISTDNSTSKNIEADRTLLDQTLKSRNAELELARTQAEKANLAKSDFLSSMSHELRTPLGAILGFAQLLESGSPPPTVNQKRSIDQILKAGWYLLELINEILDLSLIESGKISLSMEPVSLSAVLSECQMMVEPQAHKSGIQVVFNRSDDIYFVQADRTRLKQVLINLLSNAIKYNRVDGTVTVDCSAADPKWVRVSVRDTGAGLTPEQLPQLFQPFNRFGQDLNGEEGTGIGLVVCKRLVELMGGQIGFASTLGEGSLFWFQLAAAPATQASLVERAPIQMNRISTGRQPLQTLLYVEDNPANLMLVEDLIARRSDVRLLTAHDGHSGIEMARAHLPDVILMDINLPGISGIGAMRVLAKDVTTAHIPVIALSANAIPRDIEKGLEAGFLRYLTKPIKIDAFMEAVDLGFEKATKARTTNLQHH